MTDLIE